MSSKPTVSPTPQERDISPIVGHGGQFGILQATFFGGLSSIIKPTMNVPVMLVMLRHNPKFRERMFPTLAKVLKEGETPSYKKLLKVSSPYLRKTHARLFVHWAGRIGITELSKIQLYKIALLDPQTCSLPSHFVVTTLSGMATETLLKGVSLPLGNLSLPRGQRLAPYTGFGSAVLASAPMVGLFFGFNDLLNRVRQDLVSSYSNIVPWAAGWYFQVPWAAANAYLAAVMSEIIVFPLDDTKRIQSMIWAKNPQTRVKYLPVLLKNYDVKGLTGLWNGCFSRARLLAPNYAWLFLFYEGFKTLYASTYNSALK